MATKRKDYEDLIKPEAPGAIDKTAVNNAAQGYTAAKSALDSMSYDNFKQGSMYQGLQKDFSHQGQQAMKDTLGQVAARTGGMASSWAATAAQQGYNNYMRQLEDVARSMYNDEYSKARDKVDLAQNEYNRAYGEYRDSYDDAWDAYDRDMQAYRYDVEDQQVAKATKDNELKGVFGAENFLWGDWDGDGNVEGEREDKTFEDLYGGSSYGEDYWKAYAEGKAKGFADEANKETVTGNSADISARISNGESLEDIAEAYGIDNDAGWKTITGKSQSEWQKFVNDNKVGNYHFADTSEGRANIVNKLVESGLYLNATDADNFDYIWGDGAYNAIQTIADSIKRVQPGERDANDTFDYQYENIKNLFPGIPNEVIMSILEKANPKAFEAWK